MHKQLSAQSTDVDRHYVLWTLQDVATLERSSYYYRRSLRQGKDAPRVMLDRLFYRLATSARKKLRLGHSLGELEPSLASKELIFRAPELDTNLVAAVKLISPQFHLTRNERSRRFWELNQNGLCWGEFEALAPVLENQPPPRKVLDIGPGMGRSVVFFKKKMGWQKVPFHLYESTGDTTNYTKAGPRFDDSFCGNLDNLKAILAFNKVENTEIFDAGELGARLDRLPGPYDFIYSFFAIGFHWSLEHFLPEILDQMHDNSVAAFTLHPRFDRFDEIKGAPYRVVRFRRSWPRGRWSDLMVMSKNEDILEPLGQSQ